MEIFSWVIIGIVRGWETTIILLPPSLLGWFPKFDGFPKCYLSEYILNREGAKNGPGSFVLNNMFTKLRFIMEQVYSTSHLSLWLRFTNLTLTTSQFLQKSDMN